MPSEAGEVVMLDVEFELEPASALQQVIGKTIYTKTNYIILKHGSEHMLLIIEKTPPVYVDGKKLLFSRIVNAKVLASPSDTRFVGNKTMDVLNPTAMARHAKSLNARCLVVQGRGLHISFVLDPEIIYIDVHDNIPPFEPRLFTLFNDAIPLIKYPVVPRPIFNFLDKLVAASKYSAVMLPCETEPIDVSGKQVLYLNHGEKPIPQDIELIGCDLTIRAFKEFYGYKPVFTNICPRLLDAKSGYHLARCCDVKRGFVVDGNLALVGAYPRIDEVAGAINAMLKG